MLNAFLDLVGGADLNVEHMINKARGELAYTMIDLGDKLGEDIVEKIRSIPDVYRVRLV